jgi:uridine kinase
MRGDIILVEEYHRQAAEKILDHIFPAIQAKMGRYAISVAGESGSGKSETAQALADGLKERGVKAVIFQQDDYFIHPPKTNDATRRQDISWVGPNEVKLDLLDTHIQAGLEGVSRIFKPLVIYEEDRISEEKLDMKMEDKVLIAEGTYTSLLENIHTRVFIARNRLDTLEHRKKRGREAIDPFIEEVLKIEHEIIAPHRSRADIIITREYDVILPE